MIAIIVLFALGAAAVGASLGVAWTTGGRLFGRTTTMARVVDWLFEVPFHPQAGPRGNYTRTGVILTSAVNVFTWALLFSVPLAALVTIVAGFFARRKPAAT